MADLLEQVHAALANHDLRVEAQQADGGSAVVVWLGTDERTRPRGLAVTVVPSPAEGPADVSYLQVLAELPFTLPADRASVYEAIAIVNRHVGIGGFGLDEKGRLFYRYVLPVRTDRPLDEGLVAGVVDLASYLQEYYGDYLDGVFSGDVSIYVLDDVIARSGG